MELLKVSKNSAPKLLAGAIAAIIRKGETVEIRAIGAGAVNQAVKGIAVARIYLEPEALNLIFYPLFDMEDVGGVKKTSIQFVVENRFSGQQPEGGQNGE